MTFLKKIKLSAIFIISTSLNAYVKTISPDSLPATSVYPFSQIEQQELSSISAFNTQYWGGPITSNMRVINVLWGADVDTSEVNSMPQFLTDLVTSSWIDGLGAEYNTAGVSTVNSVPGTNQALGRGSFVSQVQITPSFCSTNSTCTVTDAQIQTELKNQLDAASLPLPTYDSQGNGNTIYVIEFPPNVTIDGSAIGVGDSCTSFCAYHGTMLYKGNPILYSIHPDYSTGLCNSSCDFSSGMQVLSTLENQQLVHSHEIAEAITDPYVGIVTSFAPPLGWYDRNNGEVGDACGPYDSGPNAGATAVTLNGHNYVVQNIWFQSLSSCLAPSEFPLPSNSITWTGSSSQKWSRKSNWTSSPSGGFPLDQCSMLFPQSSSNYNPINDEYNLQLTNLTINPPNNMSYTFTGHPVSVSSQILINLGNTSSKVNLGLDLSGTASLTLQSLGTTTLTGTNTYSGATTVTHGKLIANTSSLPNNPTSINTGSILEFNQNTSGTFSGQITGSGNLIKSGTNTLILTALNSPAATLVKSGELKINAQLTSTVTVAYGSILSGIGPIVGPVTNRGTTRPGNSIGTMSTGSYTQTSNGKLTIELDSSGNSSLLHANGTASLKGLLRLVPDSGTYATNTNYTVLTSTGNRTGKFKKITSSMPRLSFKATYLQNSVNLLLKVIPFHSLVVGNAQKAATAFCSMNDSNDFVFKSNPSSLLQSTSNPNSDFIEDFLNLASISQLQCDFNQMHPALYNAIPITQESALTALRKGISDRMEEIHYSAYPQVIQKVTNNSCLEKVQCCNTLKNGLWVEPFGDFSNQQNRSDNETCDDTRTGFHATTYGVSVGYDRLISKQFAFGVAASYSHTDLNWKESQGDSDSNSGFGTLYGSLFNRSVYLDFSITGGYNSYEAKRVIHLVNQSSEINRYAKNNHNGAEVDAHLELGFNLPCKCMQFTPFALVDYIYVHESNYTENGAKSLDLSVQSKNSNLIRGEVGFSVSSCQVKKCFQLSEEIRLSYVREERTQGRNTEAHFTGSSNSFTVSGFLPDRNLISPGAALTLFFPNKNFSIKAVYSGEFNNKWSNQTGSIECLWQF